MRIAIGVIVAFVSMSLVVLALSLAPWFVLGVDAVLQPGRFDSTVVYNGYAVLVGILGALMAGWLCATIARTRIAVIVLAVLCFAGGMINAVAQSAKADPGARAPGLTVTEAMATRKEPAWFTWLMPCAGAAAALLAGWRVRGAASTR